MRVCVHTTSTYTYIQIQCVTTITHGNNILDGILIVCIVCKGTTATRITSSFGSYHVQFFNVNILYRISLSLSLSHTHTHTRTHTHTHTHTRFSSFDLDTCTHIAFAFIRVQGRERQQVRTTESVHHAASHCEGAESA